MKAKIYAAIFRDRKLEKVEVDYVEVEKESMALGLYTHNHCVSRQGVGCIALQPESDGDFEERMKRAADEFADVATLLGAIPLTPGFQEATVKKAEKGVRRLRRMLRMSSSFETDPIPDPFDPPSYTGEVPGPYGGEVPYNYEKELRYRAKGAVPSNPCQDG